VAVANAVGGHPARGPAQLSEIAQSPRAPTGRAACFSEDWILMRAPARYAVLAILAIAWAGCITPSIPIPPPDADLMTFEVDVDLGEATFTYDPDPDFADAIVYVFNRTQGEGLIATARGDGSVGPTDPFPAALGDEVAVTFETDDQIVSTCVIVRQGRPDGTQVCN
jgi:hypothetical protein